MDSSKLTDRNVVLSQVSRLRDQLDIIVPKLSVLADAGCTREKARAAWDWVFNHEFWAKKESTAEKAFATLPYSVRIQCALARKHGGITYKEYPSGAFVLPKGIHLRFSIAKTNAPAPFSVRWVVDNEGDEAIEEHQQHWERTEQTCWTNTKYKGHQRMTCELISGNQILARAKHLVKISASGRWGVD